MSSNSSISTDGSKIGMIMTTNTYHECVTTIITSENSNFNDPDNTILPLDIAGTHASTSFIPNWPNTA
jgi:hypothetical protein